MKESFFRCTALFLLSLACLVGQTFALPAAALVGDEGDQCTSQPGDEQGDEQADGEVSVWLSGWMEGWVDERMRE